MALVCPNCKKDLVTKNISNVEVDLCEHGCLGIWFDDGELRKIKEADSQTDIYEKVIYEKIQGQFVPKPKEEALNEEERICPRCKVKLYRYNWDITSNIFLDSCQQCGGVWVDNGKLKGMSDYLASVLQKTISNEGEVQEKLARIQVETTNKMLKDKEENIQKLIDWDILFFDDILRFIVKKLS